MSGKKAGADEIAKQTQISKSTVSKALNNSGGVDAKTKDVIVKTAEKLQYHTPTQRSLMSQKKSGFVVGVVMPINPYYFWSEAIRGMKEVQKNQKELHLIFSLFANMLSEHDAMYCLEYIENLQVDLLVVAPPTFPSIRNKLTEISAHIPVVCFNETADIPYLFYAGTDFRQDGIRLAGACAEFLQGSASLLNICGEPLPMVQKRDDAFRQRMTELIPDIRWIDNVDIRGLSTSVLSAQLARILHEKYQDSFQCIYVSLGFLPQICLALRKLELTKKTAVFGYENPNQSAEYIRSGTITAFLEQDMYEQGRFCMLAVYGFLADGKHPDNNCVYAPSKLYKCNSGKVVSQ